VTVLAFFFALFALASAAIFAFTATTSLIADASTIVEIAIAAVIAFSFVLGCFSRVFLVLFVSLGAPFFVRLVFIVVIVVLFGSLSLGMQLSIGAAMLLASSSCCSGRVHYEKKANGAEQQQSAYPYYYRSHRLLGFDLGVEVSKVPT
jgi:hypothetical protein